MTELNDEKLFKAAKIGDTETAKMMIEMGADVNARNDSGLTPLYWASLRSFTDIAKILIEMGADVNVRNKDGYTPLYWVSSEGHTEIAKMLIEKGADVNAKNEVGETPLQSALEKGHSETAKMLIEMGADVNAKNEDSETPLQSALEKDHTEIAKMKFELSVTNVQDMSALGMPGVISVSGELSAGQLPQKGDAFRIARTGAKGVVDETMTTDELVARERSRGARVVGMPGDHMTFTTSGLSKNDVRVGDKVESI